MSSDDDEVLAIAARIGGTDGAQLLDDVHAFIGRFVAFPSKHALIAVTLWAVHTHLMDVWDSTPRLALLSPEPGSGKSRTLEVLELLTPRPMFTLNASVAPIFRSIESEHPTLLMDEVDAIFGRSVKSDDPAADLRALLNAGHRIGATIPRCVGPRHEVQRFPVYAPVALAGLGDLPDTLLARSLIIRMRKRLPTETIGQFRHRMHGPEGYGLRDRLELWAKAVADRVAGAWPTFPPGIEDRDADVWEALLMVADAAGGEWPERARVSAVSLVTEARKVTPSLGVLLLRDLRRVWGEGNPDAMATETILDRLHQLEEAPWNDLRGKPLDARGLAHRLGAYEVRSRQVRLGARTCKGYRREDLWDAWTRYADVVAEEADTFPKDAVTSETTAADAALLGES